MHNDDFRACIVLLSIGFTSYFIEYGRFASAGKSSFGGLTMLRLCFAMKGEHMT